MINEYLGPYGVVEKIGEGGMGAVYRARDTRLDRDVALKILPAAFASNPERVARFQREAKALAQLNHPNIAAILGVEETGGTTALVMELVEGADLAEHLSRSALPLDEALPIAAQIADALEAAHQQGIIHRDLKPANVKLRADGTVKLLDFGLAKILDSSVSGAGVSQGPTITSDGLTGAGRVLGTAAYMSPEQARGRAVDKRTDIWAFGCVLFEMLTGARAFGGTHQSDVVAAILKTEPDFTALPPGTPPAIRRLLRRCLAKDPSARLRDIGDARLELREVEPLLDASASAPPRRRSKEAVPWILAAATIVLAIWLALRPNDGGPQWRGEIVTPPSPSTGSLALSPDSRLLAFVAASERGAMLWLRDLQSGSMKELAGTEGGFAPFWSPDGRSLGFFAHGKVKRIDVDSGSIRTLANASTGASGTWGSRNVILFASRGNPIMQVDAEGGEATVARRVRPGSAFAPSFLPDGRRFLYFLRGSPETRGVHLGDLDGDSTASPRLLDSESGAVYSPKGQILFTLRNTLFSQPFDAQQAVLRGDPRPVSSLQSWEINTGIAASRDAVAYRTNMEAARQLIWFDRAGRQLAPLGPPGETFSSPSLSRDGRRVLFYRGLEGNVDIWTMDTTRGTPQRLTRHPADDVAPVWSPDGSRIAFSSTRSGTLQIYVKTASLDAPEEELLTSDRFKTPTDWSPDGNYLLFNTHGEGNSQDIWAGTVSGDRRAFPVVRTAEFNEQFGQFAPGGGWIAYQSDESGRPEIYLQSFPSPDVKLPVSANGGMQVRFSDDGRELFFIAPNGDLMSVALEWPAQAGPPSIGTPQRLFAPPIANLVQLGEPRLQYMVSKDAQRFLFVALEPTPTPPVSVIFNWHPPR